jgi:F-type H+-transporting ATPase subunit b
MRKVAFSIACISILGLATLGASPALATAPKPEAAHAGAPAEHPGHAVDAPSEEVNLETFVVTVVIFLFLLAVVTKTGWKPILTGLKNRENAIRDSIEAAKKAREEAERTTRDLEAKMAEFQRQAAQQLQQSRADAQKVADSIRAQAETESAALKERTLREIEAAKQQALSDINSHAADLGTAVARRILQRDVNTNDQQRLVEESLAELAKKN